MKRYSVEAVGNVMDQGIYEPFQETYMTVTVVSRRANFVRPASPALELDNISTSRARPTVFITPS